MTVLATARKSATARRAQRRQPATLRRELAGYASPADRLELDAMMARHPDDDTADLRSILAGIHA